MNEFVIARWVFLLLLALEKNFFYHTDSTRAGGWKRKTGHELLEKTIGLSRVRKLPRFARGSLTEQTS